MSTRNCNWLTSPMVIKAGSKRPAGANSPGRASTRSTVPARGARTVRRSSSVRTALRAASAWATAASAWATRASVAATAKTRRARSSIDITPSVARLALSLASSTVVRATTKAAQAAARPACATTSCALVARTSSRKSGAPAATSDPGSTRISVMMSPSGAPMRTISPTGSTNPAPATVVANELVAGATTGSRVGGI